jgi:dextranase
VTELLPTKASFRVGEPVDVEIRGAAGAVTVSLWHLDEKLDEVVADGLARFAGLEEGGYGIEADGARTAVDVVEDPLRRLRYGFVADFAADRDVEQVVENARRLHLNAVMFYDWMYRHADLLPPELDFDDALGRHVSLDTVRSLVRALQDAGSLAVGYAAVYAVGREHWPEWSGEGLYHADGTPWRLGDDFLWIVDPSSERWLEHFADDLVAARESVGFDGFHLDQFGWPKAAIRQDGTLVDLAEAFPALIGHVRDALGSTRLVFNNVNDFPTWSTATAPQDAVYVEVWPPHDSLAHLGGLVTKAKGLAPEKSVSLAAYLTVFAGEEAGARHAMLLQVATVFAHGGTCLLHGEADAVLVDPYYVRNHRMDPASTEAARAYYDFAVRYGELLFDPAAIDVTRTHFGGINDEVRIEAPVPVGADCLPGALWARVVETTHGLLVHLIDLSSQETAAWDAPKRPALELSGVRLAVERPGFEAPEFFFASPESSPALKRLEPEHDGRHDLVSVPPFTTWALIWAKHPV